MDINYKKAFMKSFLFRVSLNVIFLITLYFAMNELLMALPLYQTNLSSTEVSNLEENGILNTASYIFDETSILVTQAGLMVVALMTLVFGLDHFKIKQRESYNRFRRRLLLYTMAHLFSCMVISIYLMCSVGLLSYPQSLRLNADNAFIWSYPSYAIIAAIYLVELYKFYTENDQTKALSKLPQPLHVNISEMKTTMFIYMCSWIAACLFASILTGINSKHFELFHRDYRSLLFQPWKVTSFLVATFGMGVIAPYTGDPTWDYYDSTFMCILAYLTAPWAIGTLYLKILGKTSWTKAYVASCLWMFTSSWSYDLYILIKEGSYPMTWLPNLFASSVLYVCAGLLWSLEWYEGRGVIFGFMHPNWPEQNYTNRSDKIMWYALPFMVLVIALTATFFI